MSLALKFLETRTWAILDEYLQLMAVIADRDMDAQVGIVEAIEKRFGSHIAGTREATVRNGIGVIPVAGPMFRYANFFTEISGATSFERLAVDIGTAMENDEVVHLILDVNSPGGEVDGAAETAELIASYRGIKPITAFISHLGASAGYWIASAADEVIVSETSMVGSIGAVIGVTSYAEADKKRGIQRMEFVSSQSPDKRVDPFSDDEGEQARANTVLQGLVDKMAGVFIEKVAGYRDMTEEAIMATKGGILIGADAVEAGLADSIGTLEGLIDSLGGSTTAAPALMSFAAGELTTQEGAATMDKESTPAAEAPVINRAFLDAHHGDLVAEIKGEGATEERDRVLGIHALEAEGFEELKTKLMEDPKGTRGEAAAQILNAKGEQERRRREAVVEGLEADEQELENVSASTIPDEDLDEEGAAVAAVLAHAR